MHRSKARTAHCFEASGCDQGLPSPGVTNITDRIHNQILGRTAKIFMKTRSFFAEILFRTMLDIC